MKGRIYRLTELMQKVDRQLRLERQRRKPDAWIVLKLTLLRHRIRCALERATTGWTNPHRAIRAQKALSLMPV